MNFTRSSFLKSLTAVFVTPFLSKAVRPFAQITLSRQELWIDNPTDALRAKLANLQSRATERLLRRATSKMTPPEMIEAVKEKRWHLRQCYGQKDGIAPYVSLHDESGMIIDLESMDNPRQRGNFITIT